MDEFENQNNDSYSNQNNPQEVQQDINQENRKNDYRRVLNQEPAGQRSFEPEYRQPYMYQQPPKQKKKKVRTGIAIALLILLVSSGMLGTTLLGIKVFREVANSGRISAAYTFVQGKDNLFGIDDETGTDSQNDQTDALTTETQVESIVNSTDLSGSYAVVTDVTDVVKRVMPSVVAITSTFTENYVDPFGRVYSEDVQGSGSGIIFGQSDTELWIVTNYHVVEDGDTISVQFIDDSIVTGQVKGFDEDVDLAVVAIQLTDLSNETISAIALAQFGDSDALTVGEPAIAIGNALGYGQSVTTGVVSALDRTVGDESTGIYENLIQTDAAINPGNSGGALLNIYGEVIGINSNKMADTTIEGMGYAIPISKAIPIIQELTTHETRVKVSEAEQGYIGIRGADVSEEDSEVYHIPVGIYVSTVYENTGASEAGLKAGDVIIGLNGDELLTMASLQTELQYYSAGDVVTLTIQRSNGETYETMDLEVELVSLSQMSN